MKYFSKLIIITALFFPFIGIADEASFLMVGSSTVYPFEKLSADTLSEKKIIPRPKLEVTGTGLGFKKLCDISLNESADISGASRRIKIKELEVCTANHIDLIELTFGLDAVVVAQSLHTNKMNVTTKQLFLALAAKVPQGNTLIDNPYHFWDEIDGSLPHRAIEIWGPPEGSGTRDIITEYILSKVSKTFSAYGKVGYNGYKHIREDGVFHNDHEDHEKSVRALERDSNAIGMFGFSYYLEHQNRLAVSPLDGVMPTHIEAIRQLIYPMARLLYVYVKAKRLTQNSNLKTYVTWLVSEDAGSSHGVLVKKLGLVPLLPSMLGQQELVLHYKLTLKEGLLKE
jgi:phosphate transport system substrate-binding protein